MTYRSNLRPIRVHLSEAAVSSDPFWSTINDHRLRRSYEERRRKAREALEDCVARVARKTSVGPGSSSPPLPGLTHQDPTSP